MILQPATVPTPPIGRSSRLADDFRTRSDRDVSDRDSGAVAIALYERALRRDPSNHLLLLDLARAYASESRRHDAERLIARVIELYPRSAMVRFKVARLYRRLNRPILAIKHFRQTLELDPCHPKSTEILVEMSILAGRYGKDRHVS